MTGLETLHSYCNYLCMENLAVRVRNRGRVLGAVAGASSMSRGQVGDATALSKATISRVVRDLLDDGLLSSSLSEAGIELLSLSPKAFTCASVDIGPDWTRALISNAAGDVVRSSVEKTPVGLDAVSLARFVSVLLESDPDLDFVIVTVPGAVHPVTGDISEAPNLPFIEGGEFYAELRARSPWPVLVENDSNAAVLGEISARDLYAEQTVVMFTLDIGVGAGVVLGGELLRGRDGRVGEFGSLRVHGDGPRIEDVLRRGSTYLDELGADAISSLLGVALVAYEARTLLFGGSESGPLWPLLEEGVRRAERQYDTRIRLLQPLLRDDAAVVGAIALAMRRCLQTLGIESGMIRTPQLTKVVSAVRARDSADGIPSVR